MGISRYLAHLSEEELLPPTAKRRVFERIALSIRSMECVPLDTPIDPWRLAERCRLKVVDINQIEGLSSEAREVLLKDATGAWSGATLVSPLPNGTRLVFLNGNHSRERQAATLMEEVCHIILGHSPSQLTLGAENSRFRSFNATQEKAAFDVGAATLLPFAGLRHALKRKITASQIARRFRVSNDLVIYRMKVCRLWDDFKNLV